MVSEHAKRRQLSRVFRRDQRYVNQMLAQEPRLKLGCAQDFADKKIIGAVVAAF